MGNGVRRNRNYVGVKTTDDGYKRERFLSSEEPTFCSHGDRYVAVIGPFRSKRGALCCVHYGNNNPHAITVGDFERIGKKYAADLDGKPDSLLVPFPTPTSRR